MDQVWLNGAIAGVGQAQISVADRGFLLGDGAFETLSIRDGAPRHIAKHAARLEAALSALHFNHAGCWINDLFAGLDALLEATRTSEAVARLTISRGPGPRGLWPDEAIPPTRLVTLASPPQQAASMMLAMETGAMRANCMSARHKWTGYGEGIAQLLNAQALLGQRPADVVVISAENLVLGGSFHNLFMWKENALWTPPRDLPLRAGVMREAVIEAADALGIACKETPFEVSALWNADAVFLTNAVRGLCRVDVLKSPMMQRTLPEEGFCELDGLHALLT
jgi:branched-chain amino acid aminotransferase